jgi:GntR family transcriptional regulator
MPSRALDLDGADLRIRRGSVPASTQLAEALKAQIIQQRLPRGGTSAQRAGVDRALRSEPGDRACGGGNSRAPGLAGSPPRPRTFVANPVRQELGSGVRTITEVLASSGITPQVDVLSHRVGEAPQRVAETLGLSKVLCINRRFRDGDRPLALMTAYLPLGLEKPSSR